MAMALAGCLSGGEPPSGRQLTNDLDLMLLDYGAPLPRAELTTAVLAVRWASQSQAPGLYLLEDRGPSETLLEKLLVPGWAHVTYGPPCHCMFPIDSRGRMFAESYTSSDRPTLLRVDLVTGERLDLGARQFELSPSGRRLVLVESPVVFSGERPPSSIELEDEDGRALWSGQGFGPRFVGEDLYFWDSGRRLMRVLVSGSAEVAREDVDSFEVQETTRGPLVIISSAEADEGRRWVLDPRTMEENPIPAGGLGYFSDDGEWILIWDWENAVRFTLHHPASQASETFDLAENDVVPGWRPGRHEIWLSGSARTWVKRPGEAMVEVDRQAYSFQLAQPYRAGGNTNFSGDGRFWFTAEPGPAQNRWDIFVGPADDPGGPRFAVNPSGSGSYGYWSVGGGDMLVEAWYIASAGRSDFVLVNPETGQMRTVGQAGRVLRAAGRRALALQRLIDGAGDLTVIDLDAGETTLLAENVVAAVAVPTRPDDDALAPGTRVVFMVRHRFGSPYDGLWITTLP